VGVAPVGERGTQANLLGADIDAGDSAAGDPAGVAVTGLADAAYGAVRDGVASRPRGVSAAGVSAFPAIGAVLPGFRSVDAVDTDALVVDGEGVVGDGQKPRIFDGIARFRGARQTG